MRTPQDKAHISKLRELYKSMLKSDFSYKILSTKLGVSKGCLWRFVNKGYLPKDIKKRSALGVKLITVDILACPNCGGAHTRKCREKKPPRKLQSSRDLAEMIWWVRYLKRREI